MEAAVPEADMMESLTDEWIRHASENPKRVKEVLAALRRDGDCLSYINPQGTTALERKKDYRSFVMAAVKQSGTALRFASEELQDDEDVVVAAVAQEGRARAYASAELRGMTKWWMAPHNREVLPAGICHTKSWTFRRSELELVDASPDGMRRRRDASEKVSALNALERKLGKDLDGDGDVGQEGKSTKMKKKENKKRQAMINALERERGVDLDGDGDIGVAGGTRELPTDTVLPEGARVRDICGKAKFATPAIAENALGTVTEVWSGETLFEGDDGWRYRVSYVDEGAVLTVLNQSGCRREDAYDIFRGAAPEIQAMRDVAKRAVALHGGTLAFVPEELQRDTELVKAAVAQNGYALRFAFGKEAAYLEEEEEDEGPNLKKDEEVVKAAITKPLQPIQKLVAVLDEETGQMNTESVMIWPKSGENRGALRYADRATQKAFMQKAMEAKRARARKNRAERFSKDALKENGYAIRYAPPEVQADKELVLAAVTKCGAALEFVSTELQNDEDVVRAALRQNPFTPPIAKNVQVRMPTGQMKWQGVELVKTWEPDTSAWGLLPGSSKKPGALRFQSATFRLLYAF